MSLTSTAAPVAATVPRRFRYQARDVAVLMAFSATSSIVVAAGFLLLAHLSSAGR